MQESTERSQGPSGPQMAVPSAPGLLFSRGWVGNRDLVWVLAHEEPDTGEYTRLLKFKMGHWEEHIVEWGGIAITAETQLDLRLFVIGVAGNVLLGQPTGFIEEHVNPSSDGPSAYGLMRDARIIGDWVVAVGMSRQVYRRPRGGTWRRIDQGLLAQPVQITGLNSVDGFGISDLYVAGLHGEFWHYNGSAWRRIESPTNVVLHRVRCVVPHTIYACGAAGTLLQLSATTIQVVAPSSTSENLYGLEWFNGRLYVAGQRDLFVLDGDDLVRLDVGLGDGLTFGDLHAADGVLWSFGPHHLLWTDDGSHWTQVFCR